VVPSGRASTFPRAIHQAAALANLGALDHDRGGVAAARARYAESLALRREMGERGGVATLLEGFAGLAAAEERPAPAWRLRGAAAAIRAAMGSVPPPEWRDRLQRWLGPPPGGVPDTRRAAAWAEGQAMPLEEAVADALNEAPD
jgi:hypothetical protein